MLSTVELLVPTSLAHFNAKILFNFVTKQASLTIMSAVLNLGFHEKTLKMNVWLVRNL
jgi:hypothetical protein